MLHLPLVLASLLSVPAPSASPAAAPSVKAVYESLRQVRHFRDTAVAPDGARAAWSEKVADANGEEILGAISVADLPAGKPRRLTAGKDGKAHREWGAAFSPDGRTIAFLSDAAARGQLQIWLAPAAGGPPRQLTRVKGQIDHLLWSADGKSLAFLFVEGSAQETGALVAYKPDSGVVQEEFEEQRIAVADAKTGQVRQVSPADMYVYDYDWSPDGATFAAEAVKGSGTNNYWVAELYRVDAATGQARSILKPSLQIACPRFSPDGKFVAFIHGVMSDEGSTGGDVWSVAIDATSSRNLTPNMKWSARALFWTPTAELLFTAEADGGHGVASVDFGQGTIRPLWSAAASLQDFSMARQAPVSAAICSSFEKPPEVCAGPVGQWKPLTTANAKATAWWGNARSLHWQSDGANVQGWLLYPLAFDPARRYPMVVLVHGGPSSMQNPPGPTAGRRPSRRRAISSSCRTRAAATASARRSCRATSRTSAAATCGTSSRASTRSCAPRPWTASASASPAGATAATWRCGRSRRPTASPRPSRAPASPAGRATTGRTRSTRGCCPSSAPPSTTTRRSTRSPRRSSSSRTSKTPTLVLHGDRDSEVPTPQGYEFWHALKALGVPTQLVIYTNEGHGIRQPEHQLDILERTVGWFDKYLR